MFRNRRMTNPGPALVYLLVLLIGFAPGVLAADADHLILSEMVSQTRYIAPTTYGSPFVELTNPTLVEIDLSDVYLTDGTTDQSAYYYFITLADPGNFNPGGGVGGDFHARFPAGAVLAAGDTLAVSINGSAEYFAAYGQLPDFELFEDGAVPDDVPEMVEAFPNSINAGLGGGANVPELVDVSEALILYTWDGSSDLVQDLDYILWGNVEGGRIDKTGVTIGSSTYLADTDVSLQVPIDSSGPEARDSFLRVSADEGTETTTGGNGATGHDETSENLGTTWVMSDNVQGEPSAPGSLFPSAPISLGSGLSPRTPYEGQSITVIDTLVSATTVVAVTVYFSVDGGAYSPVAAADQGGGIWHAPIPAQALGAVITHYTEAENSAGGESVHPVSAPLYAETFSIGTAPEPKLVLSEICVQGSTEEFIEIYNPSVLAVDMSDYYLTDAIYAPNNTFYWRIAEGNPSPETTGGGNFFDFHARFPDGFTIAGGDTIVVSVAGSTNFAYDTDYGFGYLPDLELFEDDAFPDDVPDMRPIFTYAEGNSIVGETVPGLTNSSEIVILYKWVEGEDLVTDIDVFAWGSVTTNFFNKNGYVVGESTYLPDTPPENQDSFNILHDFGFSFQRVDISEGDQLLFGSNGVDGRDETSENWNTTFVADLASDPSRPVGGSGGEASVTSPIALVVEAKTFLPGRGELFPVRFTSRLQSETRVRLFDQNGRLVLTLFDSRHNGTPSVVPGVFTTVAWDGRDDTYDRVKAGMYIVHLSVVSSDTGDEEVLTAPVVVATRLSR